MNDRRHLYSIYQRIKNNCCDKWEANSKCFYKWYENQEKEQEGLCHYCRLPGDTCKYYKRHFREARRGLSLEVDRRDATGQYSPENCVLACYPCNNAKSDVFSYKEFKKIGDAIGNVKKRTLRH